jgi:hypothetical protein
MRQQVQDVLDGETCSFYHRFSNHDFRILDSQKFNRVQAASLSFTAFGGRRLFRIIR